MIMMNVSVLVTMEAHSNINDLENNFGCGIQFSSSADIPCSLGPAGALHTRGLITDLPKSVQQMDQVGNITIINKYIKVIEGQIPGTVVSHTLDILLQVLLVEN